MPAVNLQLKYINYIAPQDGKKYRMWYCQVSRRMDKKVAVIADIHGASASQILFLQFCERAGINAIVSLGDEISHLGLGSEEGIYQAFADFAGATPERSFFGVRGNDHNVTQDFFPYYGPEIPRYDGPAFVWQGHHVFAHDGHIIGPLIEQGKFGKMPTDQPFVVWHGHSHLTTFAQKWEWIRSSAGHPSVVGFAEEHYFRKFTLLPGQIYWVNPGRQIFNYEDQYLAGYTQFAVYDPKTNEITMIQLSVPKAELFKLTDRKEGFDDAIAEFVKIPEHLCFRR